MSDAIEVGPHTSLDKTPKSEKSKISGSGQARIQNFGSKNWSMGGRSAKIFGPKKSQNFGSQTHFGSEIFFLAFGFFGSDQILGDANATIFRPI